MNQSPPSVPDETFNKAEISRGRKIIKWLLAHPIGTSVSLSAPPIAYAYDASAADCAFLAATIGLILGPLSSKAKK